MRRLVRIRSIQLSPDRCQCSSLVQRMAEFYVDFSTKVADSFVGRSRGLQPPEKAQRCGAFRPGHLLLASRFRQMQL